MTTVTITGYLIADDSDELQTGTLSFSFPDNVAGILSYSVLENGPGFIPEVAIQTLTSFQAYLDDFQLDAGDQNVEVYIGEITWGGGNVTQVLSIEYFDSDNFTFSESVFELGGAVLPTFNNADEFFNFGNSITQVSAITSGPFRPGVDINLTDIRNSSVVNGLDLQGSVEDELITGGYDDDNIFAFGGNDFVSGGQGNDSVRGGREEDTLNGNSGDDELFGQRNGDLLNGGNGNDRLNGGGGNDTANGGNGDDFIKGGTREDVLNGGQGDDRLFGNSFSDTLNGGNGNDLLNAGGDDDRLNGGAGDDEMKGGGGSDLFVFGNNHGDDVILDFDAVGDTDLINLRALLEISSFQDIELASSTFGTGVLISTGVNSSILLNDVRIADLDESDFIF